MPLYLLAVSGRLCETSCCRLEIIWLLKCCRQYFPLCIYYPQFHLGYVLQTVDSGLQDLVGYHNTSPSAEFPIQIYSNTFT